MDFDFQDIFKKQQQIRNKNMSCASCNNEIKLMEFNDTELQSLQYKKVIAN